jgi:hypothetical protein
MNESKNKNVEDEIHMAGEEILLCLDVHNEMGEAWGEGSVSRLDVVKAALGHFVRHKAAMNPQHRFGVCVLSDDASLVLEPTEEIGLVLAMIDACREAPNPASFDFTKLVQGVDLWFGPRLREPFSVDAPTMRCVVFFGRSREMPTCSEGKPCSLLEHPGFFLDILYVHKKLSKGNPEKLICQVPVTPNSLDLRVCDLIVAILCHFSQRTLTTSSWTLSKAIWNRRRSTLSK